jgi:hypothetical protein
VVSEGGGIRLQTRRFDDTLVSIFKCDAVLLSTTVRLRGDTLEKDICSSRDLPAIQGPLGLETRNLHRMVLRRAP